MTENEAIDVILKEHSSFTNPMSKAYVMACKALEEIQNYRALGALEEIQTIFAECTEYEAIGTIEEFKALKEKNEPKKIRKIYGTWSGDNYFKFPNNAVVYQCIECYSTVRVGENYCCNCGSCIDWSE